MTQNSTGSSMDNGFKLWADSIQSQLNAMNETLKSVNENMFKVTDMEAFKTDVCLVREQRVNELHEKTEGLIKFKTQILTIVLVINVLFAGAMFALQVLQMQNLKIEFRNATAVTTANEVQTVVKKIESKKLADSK
jgi:hypothetical protein